MAGGVSWSLAWDLSLSKLEKVLRAEGSRDDLAVTFGTPKEWPIAGGKCVPSPEQRLACLGCLGRYEGHLVNPPWTRRSSADGSCTEARRPA